MARPTSTTPPARARRGKIAAAATVLAAGAALLVLGEGASEAASRLTLATISVGEGSFADWDAVLANAAQTTHDGDGSSGYLTASNCSALSTDLDCPQTGGAGNDFLTFAWTYDPSNVYLYIERYGSTTNGVDFFFVADVNRDVRLTASDRIVHARWQPNKPQPVAISTAPYVPANGASGDPIRCEPVAPATPCANAFGLMVVPAGHVDGYRLAGSVGTETACTSCAGAGDGGGTKLELSVPWSAFGVASEQPFYWHVASSNNGSLASTADNIGAPGGGLGSFVQRGVSLRPDHSGAVLSPGEVSYVHTLTNDGNDLDLFDLSATSSQGAQLELLDGATVVATDATGDGTWDSILAGHDQDGDGRPDVALAPGASRDLTVRITMPEGRSGQDSTRIAATSGGDPTVLATATDTTHVGTPAFVPERQEGYTVPAGVIDFRDTLFNGSTVEGTFDLTPDAGCAGSRVELALDTGGGPGSIVAVDALGDGAWDGGTVSPSADSDGDGLPDLGPLAGGTSRSFHVLVTPPAGAPLGSACTLALAASGGGSAAAGHVVHVAAAVTFDPEYRGSSPGAADAADARVPKGSRIFLPAFVRNAESTPRVYDLSVATVGAGATVPRIWSDPDGDGNPSDGQVVSQTAQLAAWGGTQHLVIEVGATSGATSGTLFVTTATATAVSGGAADTEISEAVAGYLGSYADAHHAAAQNVFSPCTTVHVEARSLAPSDAARYALEWIPPAGPPPPAISPWATTANGTATAQLDLAASGPGTWAWTARLTDLAVEIDSLPFTVELAGTVSALATDRARYLPGEAVGVTAAVRNDGGASLEGTSLAYGDAAGRLRTGVDVGSGQTIHDAFTFVLEPFAAPGPRTLTLGWRLSCGAAPFAVRSASFDVVPPPPAITSPAEGAVLATATPALSGAAAPGASVVVSITDPLGTRVSASVAADSTTGAWTYAVQGADALSQGAHAATATQEVSGVASEPSSALAFTVDTVSPAAPWISSPVDGTVTASAAVSVSGIAVDPEAVSVEVLVDGVVVATVPVETGTFSASVTLAEGERVLTVRALDAAGNASWESGPVSVTADRTPPAAPVIEEPSDGAAVPPGSLGVRGLAEAGAVVRVTVAGAAAVATAATDGAWEAALEIPEGTHVVSAIATDAAGNLSPEALVSVTARATSGSGGGGCGCGSGPGAAPSVLLALALAALAPRRRREGAVHVAVHVGGRRTHERGSCCAGRTARRR